MAWRLGAYVAARVERGELAESSAEVIETVLRSWHRRAGNDPAAWTEELAARWVHDRRLRPATRKSRLSKLRPYVRWLVAEGHMGSDITAGIARVKVPPGTPRDLAPTDVEALLAACPDRRAELVVVLMVQMGLRCGDTARARVEDIDARRRLLHVRGKGGRGEPTHWAPIPTEAWDLLVPWVRDLRRPTGPLIESYHLPGEPLSAHHLSKLVGRWIRAAGLKAFPWDGTSAHALRHSCAQHMLDGGAEVREVQWALGHSTSRTTEIYLRREPPGLRAAMEGRRYRRVA